MCDLRYAGVIFVTLGHKMEFSKLVDQPVNTLRPRQNGRHFPDDILKWIFLNENVWISIEISLKFVPKCQINNIPALVQIMAWRRPGDKQLSEPMMVSLLTHICVTRPQWVDVSLNLYGRCIWSSVSLENPSGSLPLDLRPWTRRKLFSCETHTYLSYVCYFNTILMATRTILNWCVLHSFVHPRNGYSRFHYNI